MFKLHVCGWGLIFLLASAVSADDALTGAALDFKVEPSGEGSVITLAMDVEDPDELETYVPPASTFGMQDTWRFNIQAGGGFAVDSDKDTIFAFGGVGLSYFIIEDVSLELEFNVMGFDQPGEDAAGFNFNLMVRWHFIAEDTWSLYVDGGAGMLGTTANVPTGTLSFNFTPQAGIGATLEIAQDTRLFVGMRIHHVSNANIGDQNFGLDNFMAYAGVSFPF